MTVRRNVSYGPVGLGSEVARLLDEVLELFRLRALAERMPQESERGRETEGVGGASGGIGGYA